MIRRSLFILPVVCISFVGCEPPRESLSDSSSRSSSSSPPVDLPDLPKIDSPSVDSPAASSGTTAELDVADAAKEQLKKTVNPNADATWGDWAVDSAVLSGEPMPSEAAAAISLYIDGAGYVVNLGDQLDKGTMIVRRDTNPMELDITGVEGPNQGKTILAIFEQKDSNSLVVCYSFAKEERPKEFTSTPENGHFLVNYKRKVVK